jgi:hypothetical protein
VYAGEEAGADAVIAVLRDRRAEWGGSRVGAVGQMARTGPKACVAAAQPGAVPETSFRQSMPRVVIWNKLSVEISLKPTECAVNI